jgi:hypothetical protein
MPTTTDVQAWIGQQLVRPDHDKIDRSTSTAKAGSPRSSRQRAPMHQDRCGGAA